MMYAHSATPRQLAVPGIAFLHRFSADRGRRQVAAPRVALETPHRIGHHPSPRADKGREPPPLMEFFAAAFVVVAVTFGPVLAWLLLHIAGEAG